MKKISTNSLYKIMESSLKTLCPRVNCDMASNESEFPYITYSYGQSIPTDMNRNDITFDIDIWDKSESQVVIEDLADKVEAIFNNSNLPQSDILPTFFIYDRKLVPDENKKIKHRLIRVLVQNYERKEV